MNFACRLSSIFKLSYSKRTMIFMPKESTVHVLKARRNGFPSEIDSRKTRRSAILFFGIVAIAYRLRGRQEIAERVGKAAIIRNHRAEPSECSARWIPKYTQPFIATNASRISGPAIRNSRRTSNFLRCFQIIAKRNSTSPIFSTRFEIMIRVPSFG